MSPAPGATEPLAPFPAVLEWGSLVPPEIVAALRPLVLQWAAAGALPTWLHRLQIHWEDTSDAADGDGVVAMDVVCRPRYRDAVINVHPHWLALPPERREEYLVHELVHLHLAPLQVVGEAMLAALKKANRPLHDALDDAWTQADEGATCDLQRALHLVRGTYTGQRP